MDINITRTVRLALLASVGRNESRHRHEAPVEGLVAVVLSRVRVVASTQGQAAESQRRVGTGSGPGEHLREHFDDFSGKENAAPLRLT